MFEGALATLVASYGGVHTHRPVGVLRLLGIGEPWIPTYGAVLVLIREEMLEGVPAALVGS